MSFLTKWPAAAGCLRSLRENERETRGTPWSVWHGVSAGETLYSERGEGLAAETAQGMKDLLCERGDPSSDL